MTGFAARLADAGRSLATGALAGGRGAWRTAARGARGTGLGIRALLAGQGGAGPLIAVGLGRLLLQVPGDALLLALVRLVSALQTLLGVEPAGRPLDERERALLRCVFGRGLDERPLRLKHGRLGLLGLPRRAFVVADTVHVPARLSDPCSLAERAPALLVHELVHVWQHRRHGTRYLSECLLAQWLGEGYNVAVALEAGRGWDELNFEQQAELLERAFAAGWFDAGGECAGEGRRRFLLRLTEPRRDDGFLHQVARLDEMPVLLAGGWRDATPLLAEALAALRGEPAAARRP